MTRTINDIMTKDVITATTSDRISDVAAKMKDYKIGFVPIVDDSKRAVGVITDRDLVIRGYADKKNPENAVTDVMTNEVISIDRYATADEALNMMSDNKIRRLVILDNNKVAGVIAIGDLAVRNTLVDETGEALSHISTPTRQRLSQ